MRPSQVVLENILAFEDAVTDMTCDAAIDGIVKVLEVTFSVQEPRKLFPAHRALVSAGF